MLSSLRRAWRKYLASIPAPNEPELVPDGKIIREDFRPAQVDPEVKVKFHELAEMLTLHLPQETALREVRRITALLKPGVEPVDALARWISKVSTPEGKVGGFIALDWKAREEVQWQAVNLLRAHSLPLTWSYSVDQDEDWKTWAERGEAPVNTPLRRLSLFLHEKEYVLFWFNSDYLVCAFAVPASLQNKVAALSNSVALDARSEA
jgi:hypothetical protein